MKRHDFHRDDVEHTMKRIIYLELVDIDIDRVDDKTFRLLPDDDHQAATIIQNIVTGVISPDEGLRISPPERDRVIGLVQRIAYEIRKVEEYPTIDDCIADVRRMLQ